MNLPIMKRPFSETVGISPHRESVGWTILSYAFGLLSVDRVPSARQRGSKFQGVSNL